MARVGKVRVPKVQVAIDDRDHGYKRMVADVGMMDGAQIDVGVFGAKAAAKHPDSSLTVGQLATLHEFGLGGQEPRPAIGQWTDQNEDRIHDELFTDLRLALSTRAPLGPILKLRAKAWADSVREFILEGHVTPHNTAMTVEWKGHDRPLDGRTGTLAEAIDSKVTLRGFAKAVKHAGMMAAAAKDLLDSAVGIGGVSKRIRGRK